MLSLPAVTQLAKDLLPYRPYFLEEPVPPEDKEGLAYIRRHVGIPLATGERLLSKFAFQDLIETRTVDFVQPDVCHVGGLTELKKVAVLAEANHMLAALTIRVRTVNWRPWLRCMWTPVFPILPCRNIRQRNLRGAMNYLMKKLLFAMAMQNFPTGQGWA